MKQGRIYGLDMWRAALLLVGPLIHAAPAVAVAVGADSHLFGSIIRASGLFRMPVFFFIAGFLASHAQVKQIGWLNRRIVQLGVPMLSTWLLLILPIQYFRFGYFGSQGYNPVHLWFLMDLLLFSLVISNDFVRSGIDRLVARFRPEAMLGLFFLICGALAALRYPLAHVPVNVWLSTMLQSPANAIFYIGGMFVQRSEALLGLIQRRPVALSGVVLFAIAFPIIESVQHLLLPHENRLLKLAIAGTTGLVAAGMSCSIMASAIALRSRPPFISRLSQASYSIYLLHLPVIALAAPLWAGLRGGILLTYVMVVLTSFIVSWSAHEYVIKRLAWLRFLFNGTVRHGDKPVQHVAHG